jgi:hypothetical protein
MLPCRNVFLTVKNPDEKYTKPFIRLFPNVSPLSQCMLNQYGDDDDFSILTVAG